MKPEIIVAIITSASTLIAAIVSIIVSNRLLGYKMDELSKRFQELNSDVKKHNQLVERMAVVERDLKTAFNRVDEMKADIKELRRQ